ncbi:MAG: hypothetical protein GY705_11970 [Bacteroidetes bacterium]|nr:hypothetical protein [Bacteroidota bacterium]
MQRKKIILELLWWAFTAILVFGVLFPIKQLQLSFLFYSENIISIVMLVTLSRYIFLLKHTFLAYKKLLKVALVFFCIPLLFYLIQNISTFQVFLEDEGLYDMLGELTLTDRNRMAKYIRTEYLFFGVGAVICTFLFPIRMIVSVWRQQNRGSC